MTYFDFIPLWTWLLIGYLFIGACFAALCDRFTDEHYGLNVNLLISVCWIIVLPIALVTMIINTFKK